MAPFVQSHGAPTCRNDSRNISHAPCMAVRYVALPVSVYLPRRQSQFSSILPLRETYIAPETLAPVVLSCATLDGVHTYQSKPRRR
jgi:hypothetical protein